MSEAELDDFLDNLDEKVGVAGASATELPPADPEKIKHLLGYLEKLLKRAGLEMQTLLTLRESFKRLVEAKELEVSSDDNRKLVRQINKSFWSLYFNITVKLCQANEDPRELRMFLSYGLVDETLLPENILTFLTLTRDPSSTGKYPVMNLFTWLKMLYNGEEFPSVNELGVDYQKHIRDLEKNMSAAEKDAYNKKPENIKAIERVKYEIDNMIPSVTRMMASGFPSSMAPLLTKNIGPLPNNLMTADRVREVLTELNSYDFTLFYRETLFKANATTNDVVFKEIEPYFIILPVCGDKVVFWQDISGTKKTSRGRFMIPAFFMGDLRASMIKALASYRWELCRSLKGTLWADPIEGGLTGTFYDFITFLKKNSKLSIEAKEKLQEIINNNRKDIKRVFILFYLTWMDYERKGIMRLDRASREIFFKYVPFPKEVRDRLSKIPVFSDLADKYKIVTEREITRLETRYRKLKNEAGDFPVEVQLTLDYLKR